MIKNNNLGNEYQNFKDLQFLILKQLLNKSLSISENTQEQFIIQKNIDLLLELKRGNKRNLHNLYDSNINKHY